MSDDRESHQGEGGGAVEGPPQTVKPPEIPETPPNPGSKWSRFKTGFMAGMVVVGMAAPGCVGQNKTDIPNNGKTPSGETLPEPEKTEAERFEEILGNCMVQPITEPGTTNYVGVKIGYVADSSTTMSLEVEGSNGMTTPIDLGSNGTVNPGQHMTGVIDISTVSQPIRAVLRVVDPETGETVEKKFTVDPLVVADSNDY